MEGRLAILLDCFDGITVEAVLDGPLQLEHLPLCLFTVWSLLNFAGLTSSTIAAGSSACRTAAGVAATELLEPRLLTGLCVDPVLDKLDTLDRREIVDLVLMLSREELATLLDREELGTAILIGASTGLSCSSRYWTMADRACFFPGFVIPC